MRGAYLMNKKEELKIMAVFSVLVFLIIAVAHLDVAGTSKITVLDEQVLWKAG